MNLKDYIASRKKKSADFAEGFELGYKMFRQQLLPRKLPTGFEAIAQMNVQRRRIIQEAKEAT